MHILIELQLHSVTTIVLTNPNSGNTKMWKVQAKLPISLLLLQEPTQKLSLTPTIPGSEDLVD